MKTVIQQFLHILLKNFLRTFSNKKKMACEFIFPLIISAFYVFMQKQRQSSPILFMILSVLVKLYIAMIGLSSVRELITLFLSERQDKHRQYQQIYGLPLITHTISNLVYMGLYLSCILLPFYLTLNWYKFDIMYIFNFGAFVISSLSLTLMLTAFFKDHKIASEFIGMFFSLASFLVFFYKKAGAETSPSDYSLVEYIAMFMPNSSFALSIQYRNSFASLLSLSLTKLYLTIYILIEFPHPCKAWIMSQCRKLKRAISRNGNGSDANNNSKYSTNSAVNILNEQYSMKEQINRDSAKENKSIEGQMINQVVQGKKKRTINSSNQQKNKRNLGAGNDIVMEDNLNHMHQIHSQRMSQSQEFIKISNLTKTYKLKQGSFNALNSLSFSIKKGEIFCLLGRNGAGKTTLIDILTEISQPTSGSFSIAYEECQRNDPNANTSLINAQEPLPQLGICYQHEIQYDDLTVAQHLRFYYAIKGLDTSKSSQNIDKVVQKMGLDSELLKLAKQLSGGNKRKLSVAIALLGNPQLLIFDQPTSGLDPLARRAVWDILEDVKATMKSSILLTTHHLDQAEVLADFITIIQKGAVIVESTPNEIKNNYGKGYYLTLEEKCQSERRGTGQEQSVSSTMSPAQLDQQITDIRLKLQKDLHKVELISSTCSQIPGENANSGNRNLPKVGLTKIFLKFPSSLSKESFQRLFLHTISWLQELPRFKAYIEANSLEQSLVAILRDPNANGDGNNSPLSPQNNSSSSSIGLQNEVIRPAKTHPGTGICVEACILLKHIKGSFLRCLYFHRAELVRFILSYNINIIIILFTLLFQRLIVKTIVDKVQTDQEQSGFSDLMKNHDSQQQSNILTIMQAYIIFAAAFILLPVYEKEKSIRRVLNSRGVSTFSYWAGTFLFDYLYYLLNLCVVSIFILPESFGNGNTSSPIQSLASSLFAQLAIVGIGCLLYVYVFSHLFAKLTTANTWFSLLNIMLGFIVVPSVIAGKNTFLRHLSFVKYFYPFYDLIMNIMGDTLKGIDMVEQITTGAKVETDSGKYIGFCITFYLLVLIAIQTRLYVRIKTLICSDNTENHPLISTSDVQLNTVYKKYGNLQALKNVSYSIRNEGLALLGHNGAGKSTTFAIISGQINPTLGSVYLLGNRKPASLKVMQSTGICYQEDCLWENMSVSEIFSLVKLFVPIEHPEQEASWILQSLEFEPDNIDKRFRNLSGGNKRKVCLAIAVFGNPGILLLDECTTGLDPSSKSAMIQTVKDGSGSTIGSVVGPGSDPDSSSGCSTLFTTHSMGEAQEVCSKTVIMSKGQILAYDQIHSLKFKHFDCFWVYLDLGSRDNDRINSINKFARQQQLEPSTTELENNELNRNRKRDQFLSFLKKKINQFTSTQNSSQTTKIVGFKKSNKARIQFPRVSWTMTQALKLVYKLQQLCMQSDENTMDYFIQSLALAQPKLQDVYIQLTRDQQEQNIGQRQGELGASGGEYELMER